MNHAEWERKVRNLERRFKELEGFEKLGPSLLEVVEVLIGALEKLVKKRS